MRKTNPDGRLLNLNMSAVDALPEAKLCNLDVALVSFVHDAYPVGQRDKYSAEQEVLKMRAAFAAGGLVVRERDFGRQDNYNDLSEPQSEGLFRVACHQYTTNNGATAGTVLRNRNAQLLGS